MGNWKDLRDSGEGQIVLARRLDHSIFKTASHQNQKDSFQNILLAENGLHKAARVPMMTPDYCQKCLHVSIRTDQVDGPVGVHCFHEEEMVAGCTMGRR